MWLGCSGVEGHNGVRGTVSLESFFGCRVTAGYGSNCALEVGSRRTNDLRIVGHLTSAQHRGQNRMSCPKTCCYSWGPCPGSGFRRLAPCHDWMLAPHGDRMAHASATLHVAQLRGRERIEFWFRGFRLASATTILATISNSLAKSRNMNR